MSENDERPSVPLGEQADAAADFARGLVEAFGADADVEVEVDDDDDVIRLAIVGSELGLLVGPRGATISGIEELVRTMLQRLTGGQSARVRVDVDGYRERRREALAEFTRELVAKVQDSGREQALEPMGAADRKVVHDVVAPLDDVTTVSEGEEPRRRVVIRRAD